MYATENIYPTLQRTFCYNFLFEQSENTSHKTMKANLMPCVHSTGLACFKIENANGVVTGTGCYVVAVWMETNAIHVRQMTCDIHACKFIYMQNIHTSAQRHTPAKILKGVKWSMDHNLAVLSAPQETKYCPKGEN